MDKKIVISHVSYYNFMGTSIGFPIFLMFLVLKLTGIIAWSWWFVTMPLWAGLALALVMFATFAITAALVLMFAALVGFFRWLGVDMKHWKSLNWELIIVLSSIFIFWTVSICAIVHFMF